MSNRNHLRRVSATPSLSGAAAPPIDLILFLATTPGPSQTHPESPETTLWTLVHRQVHERHHQLAVARAAPGMPSFNIDREPHAPHHPARAHATAPRPQHFHLEVRPLPGSTEASASRRHTAASTAPRRLAMVVQVDPEAAAMAETVAATLNGVGFPCYHSLSIESAAAALVDHLLAATVPTPDEGHPPATAASGWPRHSPWRPGLLVPLLALLVVHSLNPWLRGVAHLRFQLPGFSYDFVTPETVPLVAPIVVGIPTVVALIIFTWLRQTTSVAPPRWARAAMLAPVVTTVFFAARFFLEGRIISSFSQIEHSRGFGMLWETIGMMEPMTHDNFRYLRPAYFNYSHTIHPILEPWSILLLALGAAGLGAVVCRPAGNRH